MTEGLQGLREDVAFMRGLAEQGRDAPMVGGSMLAWAGLIFGAASIVFYAELTRAIDPPGGGLVWLLALVLYAVVGSATVVTLRRRGGAARTPRNEAMAAAWSSAGFAIFAIWVAFALATYRTGEDVIMYMFAPIIIALYGCAWSVAASVSGKGWQKAMAGLAFVSAVAMAWFTGEPEQFLVYAAALVLTALLPGLIMMRQARAAQA